MRVERIRGGYVSTPIIASTPIMKSSAVLASTPIMGSSAVLASTPIMGFCSEYSSDMRADRKLRRMIPTFTFRMPKLFAYWNAVRGMEGSRCA